MGDIAQKLLAPSLLSYSHLRPSLLGIFLLCLFSLGVSCNPTRQPSWLQFAVPGEDYVLIVGCLLIGSIMPFFLPATISTPLACRISHGYDSICRPLVMRSSARNHNQNLPRYSEQTL
ncbi:hypothetical protein BJ166DRAFT_187238 [Pestalotiopsis sp. NC0098]|nr:hypothetical protein BJ166DRAFT_187238 [Pestalotiopsis sp. NC0098]